MLNGGRGVVVLDCALTPELVAEGLARDLIRAVQQARRDAGLDIGDRIRLSVWASPEVRGELAAHVDLVAGETLATAIEWPDSAAPAGATAVELEGRVVSIQVEQAANAR